MSWGAYGALMAISWILHFSPMVVHHVYHVVPCDAYDDDSVSSLQSNGGVPYVPYGIPVPCACGIYGIGSDELISVQWWFCLL